MNKGIKLREYVHKILYDIYKYNKSIDSSFIKYKIGKLEKRDINFINNLCLNSMRYFLHSKKIIFIYAKKNPGLHERLLLCSAITQLVFLNFKDYAVTNTTVELAKKMRKSHSFINAILKKISKDKRKLSKIKVEYSELPLWFKKNTNEFTGDQKKLFVNEFYKEPNLHLVFKEEKFLSSFEESIIKTSKNSGFVKTNKRIDEISSFNDGNWWVQDYSSSLPLNNIEENIIKNLNIDLCAAPGGKSFQILSRKKDIVLNDVSKKRIKILKENLKRLHFEPKIINYDFKKLEEMTKYDFIIIDAPCSAIGTIRKNPEILFREDGPNFSNLIKIQKTIIEKASKILNVNGIILYMVCSFLKIETVNQIENFLKKNKKFIIYNFPTNNKYLDSSNVIKNNQMLTLPTKIKGLNIDGYFAVYLKKVK